MRSFPPHDPIPVAQGLRAARVPLGLLGLFLLLALAKGAFTAEVPAGHVAVRYSWGRLDPAYHHGPGLMARLPWPIHAVEYYPIRLTAVAYAGEAADSTQQLIDTQVAVLLTVQPAQVPSLRQAIGAWPTVLQTAVEPNVFQATKGQTTQHPVDALVQQRPQLVQAMQDRLQHLMDQTLAEKHMAQALTVVLVGLRAFDFKDGFVREIDAKMRADQEAQTAAMQAEIAAIEADGQARSRELIAEAEAYRTRVVASAQAEAMRLVGDAAQTHPRLGLYEALQRWDTHPSTMQLGPGAPLVLPLPPPPAPAP